MNKCKTCYLINAKPCYECSACVSGDDHYKYWPNTQTNADRIRSMGDEELAEWLVDAAVCERVCGEDEYCHGNERVKRVTDWLKQPVKEVAE